MISSLLRDFEQVWISEESVDSPVALRLREALAGADQMKIIDVPKDHRGLPRAGGFSDQSYTRGKKTLWLRKYPGRFFRRCPGSTQKTDASTLCCNYHVLNLGSQCNFDCTYCYLQSYLTQPEVQIYTNIDEAFVEMRDVFAPLRNQPLRVGTGEIIDSLSLDPLTLYSRELISFFRDYPSWKVEFKTKSDHVDQFLDVPHAGNVVVGFSLNPEFIVSSEEKKTASVQARIDAARRARDAGLLISFHLDPLIFFEEWQSHYEELVKNILETFGPDEVDVISLGSLRFQPEQKQLMRERHGFRSLINLAEMHPSREGKLRYDARIRNSMYQFILKKFKSASANWRIFFCMETPESWIQSYEKTPSQVPGLSELFKPVRVIGSGDSNKLSLE